MLYMNELTSTQFRKVYAKLTEATLVTVNGHPIGRWVPGAPLHEVAIHESGRFGMPPQAQRDELLRKINRG